MSGSLRPVSKRRRLLFILLLLASPLMLLAVAEALVRLTAPTTAADPYLTIGAPVSVFTEVEIDGVPHFKVTHPDAYRATNLTFPVHKAPGTLRVFVLGGSASAGWPHPPGQTWSDYLRLALQRAYPDRKLELLNVGAHAYASYRVRLIFDDVIRCSPDLLVIYSGNNEFVEKRSYLLRYPGKAAVDWLRRRSRLIQALGAWWSRRAAPDNVLSGAGREHQSYHLWSHTERVAAELRSDPAQFASVIDHYRYSIGHMVAGARDRGVAVLVLTVPVNMRDWWPSVSVNRLEGTELAAWQRDYSAAWRQHLEGRHQAALDLLDSLVGREPEHAEAHFLRGRALEALGREAAGAAYELARDTDRNPFRALSATNRALGEVVAAHPGALLVDADAAFRRAARHAGVPGFDLMLDYVHPSRDGNALLAQIVFEAIVAGGWFGPPTTSRFDIGPDDGYRDAGDLFLQVTLLGLFGIMHQYDAFLERVVQVEALVARSGVELPERQRNVIANAKEEFARFVAERRKELTGQAFDPTYKARHQEFYREFFKFAASVRSALDDPGWQPSGR